MHYIIRTLIIVPACFVFSTLVTLAHAPNSYAQAAPPAVPSAQAIEYGRVADKAIEALVKGDSATFKGMLSPGTTSREQRGANAIDLIITERFIPFFQGLVQMDQTAHAFPTHRGLDGVSGVGFAHSFTVRDGTTKFFVIFVLEEKGSLTIGNLLLNKSIADVRRGL